MYRELDMTGSGSWRRALVAVGVIGAVVVLAGCSHGPDPKAQRQEMIAATRAVIVQVMSRTAMPEPAVLDDASKAIGCPSGGTQFRYVAYGVTDWPSDAEDLDQRLDDLDRILSGATTTVPGGVDYYNGATYTPSDRNWKGPRQVLLTVGHGSGGGSSLTVDFVPVKDATTAVRFEGATACG